MRNGNVRVPKKKVDRGRKAIPSTGCGQTHHGGRCGGSQGKGEKLRRGKYPFWGATYTPEPTKKKKKKKKTQKGGGGGGGGGRGGGGGGKMNKIGWAPRGRTETKRRRKKTGGKKEEEGVVCSTLLKRREELRWGGAKKGGKQSQEDQRQF